MAEAEDEAEDEADDEDDDGQFQLPTLKQLGHVPTNSILKKIELANFATSSKIEALVEQLVIMRRSSSASKAIVFSQFVNMLDLVRWRLAADPVSEGP